MLISEFAKQKLKTEHRKEIYLYLPIAGFFLILLSITDLVIFDSYVKPIIENCPPGIQTPFCDFWRQHLDVAKDAHLDFGLNHWMLQQASFYSIAAVMFSLRIITAVIFGPRGKNELKNTFQYLMASLWAISVVILFLFGWLDYLYYSLRGLPLPVDSPLSWLDDVGIFTITKFLTGTATVDFWDVVITMTAGTSILLLFWELVFQARKRSFQKALHKIMSVSSQEFVRKAQPLKEDREGADKIFDKLDAATQNNINNLMLWK